MKKQKTAALLLLVLVVCSCHPYAQEFDNGYVNNTVVRDGVGLGTVIGVVTSWSRNKSILWAIIHGLLSWIYVIYFALTRSSAEKE